MLTLAVEQGGKREEIMNATYTWQDQATKEGHGMRANSVEAPIGVALLEVVDCFCQVRPLHHLGEATKHAYLAVLELQSQPHWEVC